MISERHSNRFLGGGKTMLEIAQELKKVQNLEAPSNYHNNLQGIISQNPFSVLQESSLVDLASDVGVDISVDHVAKDQEAVGSSDPPPENFQYSSETSALHSSGYISPSHAVSFPCGNAFSTCSSPSTPEHLRDAHGTLDDSFWTMVHRHRRGKHPKKRLLI